MADAKLTALTSIPGLAAGDLFYVVDIDDTTDDPAGSSRKVTLAVIRADVIAALLALANTFTTGPQVFVGGATVRQAGGVAGTDEIQLTHDGTQGTIDCKDGNFTLKATLGDLRLSSTVGMIQPTSILQPQAGIRGYDGKSIGLAVPGDVVNAAAVKCPVAKVIGLTDVTEALGATLRSVPLTPSQITGNQNDYAPGVARFYRLSADAPRTITGLSVGQVDGQECELWNVGTQPITIANESASSAAANRFLTSTGLDFDFDANACAVLRWFAADGSGTGRWRARKGI